ncbi:MAG TPA: Stk1 family PASTA domain-containing Ser/Thr kinase [Solirubrobacteraceae bacterium]|nr:Stk1 family PASTA domain-containing Ser/Thr kinase [Solirubrobacteraceae bacterium]
MAIPQPDTIIDGRYKVLSRLGSGGMADVFLAEDQQLGRKVALKLLHGRFAADPDFVERFRREAQSAAGLQHPNVVSVYDRGTWDDTYYIAMEYLPGRSLKQLIREEAPLDPVRAIDIALQLLKAARFAHRRGVIHRDLKPHNVIVDDNDDAKVTDFGIARAGASDMTETGSIMGTAQYLSPEQAQGYAVGAPSDLYSIGIVLYEMLTGTLPFDGDAAVTIALKHVAESPRPLREINPSVPPELEQIVLWTLNKNPKDRPANADELITALQSARANLVGGEVAQHTAAMAAVAPVPVPVPVPEPAPYPLAPAEVIDEPPPLEDHRRHWLPWLATALILLLVAGGAATAYLLTRPKQVQVPPVTGDPLNTARTVLQNAGFQVASPLMVSNARPAGTVIGESPAGGTKADKGSTVTLTVSQGPGTHAIPSVVGLSRAAAEQALRRTRLKVHTVSQPSARYPAGKAVGTDPRAGTQVNPGSAVTLFVSSGPAPKAVRDVTGESQAQATADLTNAGFKVSATTQTSSTVKAGNVISQNPAGGTPAPPGSTVTIVVATAPATTPVPNVVGDTADAARFTIVSSGLTFRSAPRVTTNPAQNGIVLAQDPKHGKVKKGTVVTVTVGKFTPTNTPTSSTSTSATSSATTTSSSSTGPGGTG